MRALLADQFAAVTADAFEADLDEKDAAVVLTHDGHIVGFSTLLRDRPRGRRPASDGVLQRRHRRSAQRAGRVALSAPTGSATSSLPRTPGPSATRSGFYSRPASAPTARSRPSSAGLRLITPSRRRPPTARCSQPCSDRYGDRYDVATGVVRLEHPTPLRGGAADLPDHRLADPHVAFFARANPGWTHGDELACLARMQPDNLTAAGERMVCG